MSDQVKKGAPSTSEIDDPLTHPVVSASFPEGCTANAVTGPLCPPKTWSKLQS